MAPGGGGLIFAERLPARPKEEKASNFNIKASIGFGNIVEL